VGDVEETFDDVIKLRLSIDADMGEVFSSLSRTSQSRRAREAIHLMRLGAAYDQMLRTGQAAPVAPVGEPRAIASAGVQVPRGRGSVKSASAGERQAKVGEGLQALAGLPENFFTGPPPPG